MNTKVLEYIVAAAEEQSITRAAERFYLSQPVLSRHIKRVEQELGVPLFERTREGVRLTEGGMIFINNAQAILRREKELTRQLTALRMEQKQRVRVILDKHHHNFFVQRIAPLFRAQHPEFQLEMFDALNHLQVIRTLEEGGAELGIYCIFPTVLPVSCTMESALFLHSSDLMMVLPGSYRGSMAPEALMEEVRGGRVPVLQDVGTTYRMAEESHLALAGVRPATVMESGTFYNGLNVVMQNPQSCAYAPVEFEDQCRERGLRYSEPLLHHETKLLMAEGNPAPPAQALAELLKREYAVFMDYCVKPYQEGSSYSPLRPQTGNP